MKPTKEAALFRRRPDAKRVSLAMKGGAEDLIRYFTSVPPKLRSEYYLRDGQSIYGPREIEQLAQNFKIKGGGGMKRE